MKKLIPLSLLILVLTITTHAFATAETTTTATPATPPAPTTVLMPSLIDDIEVPYDVWIDAQTEYQGFAITQAKKTTRNGQAVYYLRVDRDTALYDSNGFYLIYDMNWKFMSREKAPAPAPKKVEPTPAPAPAPEPTPAPTTPQPKPEEKPGDDEGGSGGGGHHDDDKPPVDEKPTN